jgi:hypothetical protein
MITEDDVKDMIKSLNISDIKHYYVGILKEKQDYSLGIYSDGYADERVGISKNTMYLRLLVHWNESPGQTLLQTIEIKKKLDKLANEIWNGKEIILNNNKITRFKCGTPIDVKCDENDIYERVLHLEVDYIEGDGEND